MNVFLKPIKYNVLFGNIFITKQNAFVKVLLLHQKEKSGCFVDLLHLQKLKYKDFLNCKFEKKGKHLSKKNACIYLYKKLY